jgi:hypothetical protein
MPHGYEGVDFSGFTLLSSLFFNVVNGGGALCSRITTELACHSSDCNGSSRLCWPSDTVYQLDERRQRQKALHAHRACRVMFLCFHDLVSGLKRKESVCRLFYLRWKVATDCFVCLRMCSGGWAATLSLLVLRWVVDVDTGSLPINRAG